MEVDRVKRKTRRIIVTNKTIGAVYQAAKSYARHRLLMSRAYDKVMRFVRGYGGFSGTAREGHSFDAFLVREGLGKIKRIRVRIVMDVEK